MRLYGKIVVKLLTDLSLPHLKIFILNIRQIYIAQLYPDEIMADFLFLANTKINPDAGDYGGMSSRQYFAIVKRMPVYDGALKRRLQFEQEKQTKAAQARVAKAREGIMLPTGNYNFGLLAARAKKRLGKAKLEGEL